jgi:hypothetical protein
MTHRKLTAGMTGLALVAISATAAVAATGAAAPKSVTVKQKSGAQMKPNRYIQDELRWDKDVYTIKSGGKLTLQMTAPQEGPHTLTIVRAKDLPKTGKQVLNCKICLKLAQAHGADPNSNAPPKFAFLEDGVGQDTPPSFDKPGDSALSGPKKGDKVVLDVTAKAGSKLKLMCLIHPWMQAELDVK